jgi:hypothetical protein
MAQQAAREILQNRIFLLAQRQTWLDGHIQIAGSASPGKDSVFLMTRAVSKPGEEIAVMP